MKSVRLVFLFMLFFLCEKSLAASQSYNIGLKGIGGNIGLAMPELRFDDSFVFDLQFDLGSYYVRDNLIHPHMHFDALIEYWSSERDEESNHLIWTDISAGVALKYFAFKTRTINSYIGGALLLVYSDWEYKRGAPPGLMNPTDTEFHLGTHWMGGFEAALSSKFTGMFELKSVNAGVDYLGIILGVTYRFRG